MIIFVSKEAGVSVEYLLSLPIPSFQGLVRKVMALFLITKIEHFNTLAVANHGDKKAMKKFIGPLQSSLRKLQSGKAQETADAKGAQDFIAAMTKSGMAKVL